MAWITLGLEVVYGAITLVWRIVRFRRRTGQSPFNRPQGVGLVLGILFNLGMVIEAAAPIADLAGLSRIKPLAHLAIHVAGIVVMLAGIGLVAWSQGAMGRSWRIGVDPEERTELVTDGPFRFVRNPIYSGMMVTVVGVLLMVPNWISLFGAVFAITVAELQARVVEEPYLSTAQGAEYAEYLRQTGRFVPGIGRSR